MRKTKMNNKPKIKFSASFGNLIKYCKPYLFAVIIAVVMAVGGTIFTIIGPDKFKEMTSAIQAGLTGTMDINLVQSIALTLVIYYSLSLILSYSQGYIMASVTQKASKRMRSDIIKKINKLPLKYFDTTKHGDILSRTSNDVDTIATTLNDSIVTLISSTVMFVGAIIMMFLTNYIMAFTAIVSSLIGFVFMALVMKNSQKYFIGQRKLLGDINGHIEEVYAGHNVVKAYNAEETFNNKFKEINNNLAKTAFKGQSLGGLMMPFMNFVGNLGYVAVCVVGAVLVLNGMTTFATIVAFMIYVNLFTRPLSNLAQCMNNLQQTNAAAMRVFEFLNEKELTPEQDKTAKLTDVKGNIEFKNVKFGYDKDKTIIKDFSAKIEAGQKIAIVGPTGAGKTTMVNLLMRFYEVDSGDILVDGVSIKSLTRENVHDLFCMVLQDTWLFEGTIKDNIVYNNQNLTDEDVINASKHVGLHHFVETLPNGYNTILNEDASISAGQRQLITIARAMVDNAPMLILDEATSNVDTRTEIIIQQAMDKLMKGRTSIVIAHRLSTIKNADLILVMKDGDIIEAGNHEELLARNGFYADLYNSQFAEEE